jgi:hypothetical protein
MHCKGTKADNSHSNQHCRDQACGDLGLELFHKQRPIQAIGTTVNSKKQKDYIWHFAMHRSTFPGLEHL